MAKKKEEKIYLKKSKTTAVVLAVLFGILAWLYTYKADSWKFWLNLFLVVITLGYWGWIAWIWVIVDMAIKPKEFYEKYYKLYK